MIDSRRLKKKNQKVWIYKKTQAVWEDMEQLRTCSTHTDTREQSLVMVYGICVCVRVCCHMHLCDIQCRSLMQASTRFNDGSKNNKLKIWIPSFYFCLKWGIIKSTALAPTITAQPGILCLSAAAVIFLLLSALSYLGLPQPRITPHLPLPHSSTSCLTQR